MKNVAPPRDKGPRLAPPVLDWSGRWIWAGGDGAPRNSYAFFRRSFLADRAGTLRLRVSADSFYWLHVDGRLIARGPSRAVLDFYTFDEVELELEAGPHVLALLGHHIGEINATIMTGKPGLLVEAAWQTKVPEAGKEVESLSSGPEWKALRAAAWKQDLPVLMSHFGFWEDCDLSKIPAGWAQGDFDDSNWGNAVVVGVPPCEPWPSLAKRDIAMADWRLVPIAKTVSGGAFEEVIDDPIPSKVVASRKRSPGADHPGLPWRKPEEPAGRYLVCDFGSCLSGYVEVEIGDSTPGQILEISYDDLLNDLGAINPERSYAHLTDRFHLPGGPCWIRTLHPRGFRYVMMDLSGAGPCDVLLVSAIRETYPFRVLQDAIPKDPELRRIFLKSVETLRTCTADAYMDCASRERVQWTQDLYLANRVAYYACGDTQMMRRAVFQAAQNALPDGRINGFFPSERTNCAFASSSLLWLHQAADYWEFTRADDAAELVPTIEAVLHFVETLRDAEGVITSWPAGQFWDWAPIENEGCLLITNAICLRAIERLAGIPLYAAAAARFGNLEALRKKIHDRFWDGGRGLYRDATTPDGQSPLFSQQANAMAVWSGICPAESAPVLLEKILDPANHGTIPVGEQLIDLANRPSPEKLVPIGTLWFAHFLCEALFERGMSKEALAMIRDLWGSYDALPNFPETLIQHGNTTLCHAWAAGPAYLLPRYAPRE